MTNDELLAAVRATNQDLARLEDRMAEAEIDRAGIDAALAGKQRQLDALKQDARSTRQIAEDAREQAYIPCLVHRLC